MDYLKCDELPELRRPTLFAAFSGWNDAGEAATTAVRYLAESWSAPPFATIDPEEFFDFTVARPLIYIGPGEQRELQWPANQFYFHKRQDPGEDVVLLLGAEPHLKWKTFTGVIVDLIRRLGGARLVTMGALVAQAVHTRPPPITGFTSEAPLAPRLEALSVTRTRYEGPTGIVGTLHDACRRAGVPAMSLWVSVPPYLGATENPKAALALLQTCDTLLGLKLNLAGLIERSLSFEKQVDAAIAGNDEVKTYVEELEKLIDAGGGPAAAAEAELPPAGEIIGDLEDFLRRQRGGG